MDVLVAVALGVTIYLVALYVAERFGPLAALAAVIGSIAIATVIG